MGEICFCKDRLDFNQAGVESLVVLPEVNIYVKAAAEVECGEQCGCEIVAWSAALPGGVGREAVDELLDGGIAKGLNGELQALDALLGSGDDSGGVNDAETGGR